VTFAAQDNKRYTDLAATGLGQRPERAAGAGADCERTGHAGARQRESRIRAQAGRSAQGRDRAGQGGAGRAEAVQRQAELNLGYTTISAPIDGVVGNRTLRVGQYVQSGTQLMSVVPADGAYVVANYKETQLTDVREGQAVDIEVDMFPGQVVHGHVDSIAPASGQEFALLPPDNATGNFTKVVQRIPVRIALDTGQEPAHRTAAGHVGDSHHRDACRTRTARRRRPPTSTRRFLEHRAMSNQSPSASISALPISHAASSPAADPNRASVTTWDCRARRHDRLVHGDPEHPDHQRFAAQHRGRHRHRGRQRFLDLDLVSDRRDRGDPPHRLSQPRVLVPPLHDRERRTVRNILGRLRLHPRPALDDRDARIAGLCRRRADPDGVHARS
jgi:hypothetical protein